MKNIKYQRKLDLLKEKKLKQIEEKIAIEGLLDEDDYGRIVPPKGHWTTKSNHSDGSFYGIDGWTDNFVSCMENHPVYIDTNDAFTGRWMYFMSRMRSNKWNPDYPYDHLQDNIEKYDIICGIGDDAHFAPDYEMGLKLGWTGILNKIDKYSEINKTEEQQKFYSAHRRGVKSVMGWIERHTDKAEKMAASESDAEIKQHLIDTATVNRNLLTRAPQTFREACQWIIWYHLASRTYNRDGAGGQIDELLRPFYENDMKEGIIDRDTAVYFLACFLINDPIYWQLGGPDKNGVDQTSEISFMILEAADSINTSLNITVRVHEGMNQELFLKSLEYLIKNKNAWPRFSGDKALVEGFMRNGFSKEIARQRIAVGCNWMSLPGLEYTMNDLVKVNMAKVFEVAFEELIAIKNYSTNKLWKIFEYHLKKSVNTAVAGIEHQLKYQKYNEPELVLNLLSHGPLEKGLDVSDGGAEYYNLAIDGAGLAIVANSFAALEQWIENENKITWEEINFHLKTNFEEPNGDRVRGLLLNSDKFGNGNSLGDSWANKISKTFTNMVRSYSSYSRLYIPGFFSWANTVGFGKSVGATPDGRKASTPISHGANPSPGFAKSGASLALSNAVASIQPGYGNTAPMQWELDPGLAKTEHIELIGAIIKSHFEMGGTLINVNIMDKTKVLDAHKNPEKYPDLVVRITGFTAYFSMLTPEFRQLVVDRILES